MAVRLIPAILLAVAPVAAHAKPLTIPIGESWAFQLSNGEPVKAHKVADSSRPAKGEIMVTVRAFMGTMMTAVNGTGRSYRFKAELVTRSATTTARSCSLPADRKPIFEQWSGKASSAVRVSQFVPATNGNC